MDVLYSSGQHQDQKVVTVFVGASQVPSPAECCTVLAMDPEIQTPVLVIPFGGLPLSGVDDDESVARLMIQENTPGFMDAPLSYRCTRILNMLLIKILADRTSGGRVEPTQRGNYPADSVSPN